MDNISAEEPILSENTLNNPFSQKVARLLFDLRFVSHIPILFFINGQVFGAETPVSLNLPSEIEQPLLNDPSIAQWLHDNASTSPSIQEETHSIYYCTQKYKSNITCILGPLAYNTLTNTDLHTYMKKHHMHDFQNYHIHHASPKEAMTLISLINYVIYGNLQSAADVPDSVLSTDTSAESEDSSNISTYVRQNYRSEAEPHLPYLYEQRMYEYVRDGDLDALEKLIADQMTISGYSHGKLAYNDLKQNEYLIVTQITLYTRAAIEGGVNPYDAYDISDLLLQKLSAKPSLENYNNVMHECNRTFTAAVKKARSIAASSMYIEKCKYFISIHLRKPFSIPDIADYVGLTPAYLGTLFRQHESCTLKHYITCERLNAAKNLLKYSDFDISSIAQSLCFQNQSHFGVLFKKETGMTPAQYRKLNKPRNFYCET